MSGDFQGTGESGSTVAGIICLINKDGQIPDSQYNRVGNGKSSKVGKPSDDPSYYLALVLNNFSIGLLIPLMYWIHHQKGIRDILEYS